MEPKDTADRIDEVKIYSTDTGHQLGIAEPGIDTTDPYPGKGRTDIAARCREQVGKRPGRTLAIAALAGGMLGALIGFGAGRRP